MIRFDKKYSIVEAGKLVCNWICMELVVYGTSVNAEFTWKFKRGFVEVAVSRAVCLQECQLSLCMVMSS